MLKYKSNHCYIIKLSSIGGKHEKENCNVSTSILAIPSGKLSDKFGRSAILVPGYIIYGLVYFGFAIITAKPAIILGKKNLDKVLK